jgi:uncharacterized protein (TIGR00369 family)
MFNAEQLAFANALRKNNLVEGLGITFIPSAPGTFAATMPVDRRTVQPMGLLHGGATAALAETLGSMGSAMLVDREKYAVVGIELNANHLKGVRSGNVTATGTLLHKGRTTHVWDIRMNNEAGELVAVCRLTNVIITVKQ